jgi:hypothetical protein
VISRPTTDQILLDCRRELLETVLPAVSDPAVSVCIQMLENVLRNAATRAAHEIAWMTEESEEMLAYARAVVVRLGDPAGETAGALRVADAERERSLHIDDVVRSYSAAGEALSCAVEAALAAGDEALVSRGVGLLRVRTDREQEIKGEWAMIGRG